MSSKRTISFPVIVNGQALTASAEHTTPSAIMCHEFRVRFSDGYEDIFESPDDDTDMPLYQKPSSRPYAEAMLHDWPLMRAAAEGWFCYVFAEKINGELTNVWVIEQEPGNDERCMGVYYFGKYRFELVQEDYGWQIWSRTQEFDSIHDELADCIRAWLNTTEKNLHEVRRLLADNSHPNKLS